jgi:hypothetical protein
MGFLRATCPWLFVLLLLVANSLHHGKSNAALTNENQCNAHHIVLAATCDSMQDCCKLLAIESAVQIMCW